MSVFVAIPAVRRIVIAVAGMLIAAQSLAQPHGATPRPDARRAPELSLQAQAVAQVRQDTVTLTLAAEYDAADQATVSKHLAETLDAAMPIAKSIDAVKARSGAWRVWAVTNRDGKITGWHGRAEIQLESQAFTQAAELADKLADTMPVSQIWFSLSDEARSKQERALLVEAAQAFGERAQAAAQAFGFAGYQIRKLDLGGSGAVPVPAYADFAAAPRTISASRSSAATVPLEADTVSVVVQVSGTVSLQ